MKEHCFPSAPESSVPSKTCPLFTLDQSLERKQTRATISEIGFLATLLSPCAYRCHSLVSKIDVLRAAPHFFEVSLNVLRPFRVGMLAICHQLMAKIQNRALVWCRVGSGERRERESGHLDFNLPTGNPAASGRGLSRQRHITDTAKGNRSIDFCLSTEI